MAGVLWVSMFIFAGIYTIAEIGAIWQQYESRMSYLVILTGIVHALLIIYLGEDTCHVKSETYAHYLLYVSILSPIADMVQKSYGGIVACVALMAYHLVDLMHVSAHTPCTISCLVLICVSYVIVVFRSLRAKTD